LHALRQSLRINGDIERHRRAGINRWVGMLGADFA
jgi:hypothetical protein